LNELRNVKMSHCRTNSDDQGVETDVAHKKYELGLSLVLDTEHGIEYPPPKGTVTVRRVE